MLAAIAASLVFLQFRGELTRITHLTVLSPRAGLVVDPGSKVTYNGVVIGKVAGVDYVDVGGSAKAKLTLNVEPHYIEFKPKTSSPTSGRRRCSAISTSRSARRKIRAHSALRARM